MTNKSWYLLATKKRWSDKEELVEQQKGLHSRVQVYINTNTIPIYSLYKTPFGSNQSHSVVTQGQNQDSGLPVLQTFGCSQVAHKKRAQCKIRKKPRCFEVFSGLAK